MKQNHILKLIAILFLRLYFLPAERYMVSEKTLPVGTLSANQVKAGLPERVFSRRYSFVHT